jgi:hypothetical protein
VSAGGGGTEKSIAKIAMSQKRLPEMPKLPKIAEIEKQNQNLPLINTDEH